MQAEFTYYSAVYNKMGIAPFVLVYRTISKHVVDSIFFPIRHRFSVATESMAKEAQDVHDEVNTKKLEETNTRYKAAKDKHRHSKVFEEDDSMLVFLHW